MPHVPFHVRNVITGNMSLNTDPSMLKAPATMKSLNYIKELINNNNNNNNNNNIKI
jgi:hypothetical protein